MTEKIKIPYIKGTVLCCYGSNNSVEELELIRGERRMFPFADCVIPDEFPYHVVAAIWTSEELCYILLKDWEIVYLEQELLVESLRLNSMPRHVLNK